MRIGIVITSQTGNTGRVARELKDALAAAGHAVACEEIQRTQPRRPRAPFTRGPAPDPSAYDRLVFGGAVEAFALSPGLVAFVDALPSLRATRRRAGHAGASAARCASWRHGVRGRA